MRDFSLAFPVAGSFSIQPFAATGLGLDFLMALAIISQVLGHGIYNWCVRWMDARMVALSLLGEPIGATLGVGLLA